MQAPFIKPQRGRPTHLHGIAEDHPLFSVLRHSGRFILQAVAVEAHAGFRVAGESLTYKTSAEATTLSSQAKAPAP